MAPVTLKKQGCIPENCNLAVRAARKEPLKKLTIVLGSGLVHSKQAQAPLHSGLLATSSRRNPRPFVIDLHRAEAQVRFGPHLPRGHFKHCADREDWYFAR